MQDRYTGDIGDFAKYGLLRALGTRLDVGVAWYRYPDETHNEDGRHVGYLDEPDRWRHLDPELFDTLGLIVKRGHRSVTAIEKSRLLPNATFVGNPLNFPGESTARQRAEWFQSTLASLRGCKLVFADPDNGLCLDSNYDMAKPSKWKSMPLSEVHVLSAGRTGVVYHHNTHRKGGHQKEIHHWLRLLGTDAIAVRWRRVSPRTFFILHPSAEIQNRTIEFIDRWSPHWEFFESRTESRRDSTAKKRIATQTQKADIVPKACPECGHQFRGGTWGGIDAHWKALHASIMPYEQAWPIIKAGARPSESVLRGLPSRTPKASKTP